MNEAEILSNINKSFKEERKNKMEELKFNAQKWLERSRKENWMREKFVKDLIWENAIRKQDYLSLFVEDLEFIDLKLLLGYIIDADDYEYYMQTDSLMRAAVKEYRLEMQKAIDEFIDDVYHEMNEARKYQNDEELPSCELCDEEYSHE